MIKSHTKKPIAVICSQLSKKRINMDADDETWERRERKKRKRVILINGFNCWPIDFESSSLSIPPPIVIIITMMMMIITIIGFDCLIQMAVTVAHINMPVHSQASHTKTGSRPPPPFFVSFSRAQSNLIAINSIRLPPIIECHHHQFLANCYPLYSSFSLSLFANPQQV